MARTVTVQQTAALRRAGRDVGPPAAPLFPLIRRAARAALRSEGVRDAELSVTLLDDDGIAALNARFLQHERPTDVIAFALFDAGETPVGDIYLGFQQIARQAAAHDVPLADETARVTIHGTLHVLGFDHPDDESRLHSEMWQRQEQILAGL
jgi:probable rRNA maturation factor